MRIAVIRAPSILGLRPTGVELLPEALENAGLADELPIVATTVVTPPPYSAERRDSAHILNEKSIAPYSKALADAVVQSLQQNLFPLMLGGDCSIALGAMLGLKRTGRFGLFFMDGHADFYQPEASPTGEAADMDLALATGRGPEILTNIEHLGPYVRDEDVVQFGQRDREETIEYGSQQIVDTNITLLELASIRRMGVQEAVRRGLSVVARPDLQGFWIHFDADVISDEEMPAVDYRIPGGLSFEKIEEALSTLVASNKAVGLSLTVYNPKLDPDRALARRLVECLSAGLLGSTYARRGG